MQKLEADLTLSLKWHMRKFQWCPLTVICDKRAKFKSHARIQTCEHYPNYVLNGAFTIDDIVYIPR